MTRMFSETSFNGEISKWDVSITTDMIHMFSVISFNEYISNWDDVSSVIDMTHMFSCACMWCA